jgi:DinB superfamily
MTAAMPDSIEKWSSLLGDSREALLGVVQTARHDEAALAHATAGRMVAAWTLTPAPVDPAAHIEAQHADSRLHLARLLDQSADAEVVAPMTEQLFNRLTRPVSEPMRIDYRSVTRYTYTPRKPLRRVLDHALDHLNQIDQWQRWRRDGVAPTPTDGWVPSTVTLAEDRLPLTAPDLDGWLWRIDQATHLLVQRAAGLANDALDWQPPDGGWTLRRVLHHVARSELLYAGSFGEALPGDPAARYAEADARLLARLRDTPAHPDPAVVYPNLYGTFLTPPEVVGEVLALERELRDGGTG